MSDYITNCSNCGRLIALDEHYTEDRNDYGYPVAICDQCQNTNSSTLVVPGYSNSSGGRPPSCSWGK